MKIFVFHDLCGISSLHAQELRKHGIQARVHERAVYDLGGVSQYYRQQQYPNGPKLYHDGPRQFLLRCAFLCHNYNIIHIHAKDRSIKYFKNAFQIHRLLHKNNWKKPIVLHYHGTDIRRRRMERQKYYKDSDHIIVATPDLLQDLPDATYIPNTVDTSLFKPFSNHTNNKALYYWKGNTHIGENPHHPFIQANKHKLDLTIIHRSAYTIPYQEMPLLLNQFTYFIDAQFMHSYTQDTNYLSRTALEALACGLKVINCDGEIVEPPLPRQHYPENVVQELIKIYERFA